ncbi:MAG: helix-turn-helix domain-containing protein [Oligoflexia bacterium]|nr:helix-turn-helix domain-containing protein [Oligoflexia bacterium]
MGNHVSLALSGNSVLSDGLFNKQIWRVSDVAKFLGCSVGHIYNLVSDEKIPKVKKGKFVYFIPEKILNWVLEGDLK